MVYLNFLIEFCSFYFNDSHYWNRKNKIIFHFSMFIFHVQPLLFLCLLLAQYNSIFLYIDRPFLYRWAIIGYVGFCQFMESQLRMILVWVYIIKWKSCVTGSQELPTHPIARCPKSSGNTKTFNPKTSNSTSVFKT